MGALEAILLGLLQGLTEFLPVSSSGHLVIAQHFLGIKLPGVTFEVMVHFGTLLSIVWVFRKDLYRLITHFTDEMEEKKLLLLLIIGTIPTGLMGLFLSSFFHEMFDKPFVAGLMLLVTGCIIIAIQKINVRNMSIKEMSPWDAVLIGVFQGIAIIPGISRSGSTILGALWRGLRKEEAVRFSFLLALPAIAGASFLELGLSGSGELVNGFLSYNLLAALTAFFSGIFAITVFIKLLIKDKFYFLAYYCWLAGILTLLFAG